MARPEQELDAMNDVGKVPEARDVFSGATLRAFSHYVEERVSVVAQIKELEEQRDKLNERILNFLVGGGQTKVLYNTRPVSIVEGSRPNWEKTKMKLLEAGVSPIVIRDSAVTTSYQYLLVGQPKKSKASA